MKRKIKSSQQIIEETFSVPKRIRMAYERLTK